MLAWQWTRIGQAEGSWASGQGPGDEGLARRVVVWLVAHVIQTMLAGKAKLIGKERTALGSVLGKQVDDRPEMMPLLGQLESLVGGHGADVDAAGHDLAQAMERTLVPEDAPAREIQAKPEQHETRDDRAAGPGRPGPGDERGARPTPRPASPQT